MKGIVFLVAAMASHGKLKQCPDTVVHVMTPEPWSEMDQANLDIARERCPVKYKRSPCLKKFIRWEPLRYSAICGARPK